MTVTDHYRDHYLTVAGTQAACGWALHLLATEKHRINGGDLPLLSWTIREDGPRLAGMAFADTDEERIQAVTAWASHLSVPVSRTIPEPGQCRLECDAVAHGVEVHVQTYISAAIKEAAA